MACPSCKGTEMIFGMHYGMEYNVCQSCGTVIECDQLTVDIYDKGTKEVSANYDGRPDIGGISFRIGNKKPKFYRESLELMNGLMDQLNLPTQVREATIKLFDYTRRLNRKASIGACVYLAMKDSNVPINIRSIGNYLQVSHYKIGTIMKKLKKRRGDHRQSSNVFGVDELVPLIFRQATFGSQAERSMMLNLVQQKTKKFIHLLQDSQATTGYEPHLIILAAGYIVWKSLYLHSWDELKIEKEKLPRKSFQQLTVSVFLSEMGVCISNQGTLTFKIRILMTLLGKLAEQIPWLSERKLTKKDIIFHLNDFLELKSQIVDMTAREMSKQNKVNLDEEDFKLKEEKIDESESVSTSTDTASSCFGDASSAAVTNDISNSSSSTCINESPSLGEGYSGSSQDPKCSGDVSVTACENSLARKQRFTRVQDILKLSPKKRDTNHLDTHAKDVKAEEDAKPDESSETNGYSLLLKVTHPMLGRSHRRRKVKQFIDSYDVEDPSLLFP